MDNHYKAWIYSGPCYFKIIILSSTFEEGL